MNWINSVVRPRIRNILRKKDMPDNLWVKCPETGQMIYYKDLEANQFVVPGSNYHMRMSGPARLKSVFDNGKFAAIHLPEVPTDPLKFRDERRYTDRLKDARGKTGLNDAVLAGIGKLNGDTVVAAVQDFDFMGGSLGTAAGEAVIAAMRAALVRKAPFILFAASGGARMQEGILSLMQMPRTTVAVEELREAKLPYVVVLTHPTTGGVTASYAMLGDIHIAEPGALIGFAGPRVIEQTIREQLPNGFQRSEYLHAHGMVDMVVHRHELRGTLARICSLLTHRRLGHDIEIAPVAEVAADGAQPALPAPEDKPRPGNGLAADHEGEGEGEQNDDEALTKAPGNGANQLPPQNA
ncbi:MAG: acetyl-CoA carboxylase, carboxyltransferase subunit beta [Methyloceanibacter sp.]|uniref:acetyl-CoA carboxylase, carboxyltransferase subunit beta n=1 Tax=Methyloceanibacter sp. TaxID=1965321 RepID=UPI0035683B53